MRYRLLFWRVRKIAEYARIQIMGITPGSGTAKWPKDPIKVRGFVSESFEQNLATLTRDHLCAESLGDQKYTTLFHSCVGITLTDLGNKESRT